MRAQDFVQATVDYHNQLCPKAWDGTDIKPDVRMRLLEIAEIFIEYLEIENFNVLDVVLTGSMANYNWTKFSDFDVHVIARYSELQCDDLVDAFYRAKKHIWNNEHNIIIHGHEVEMYVEDVEDPPVSQGVYSLINSRWLKQPTHNVPEIDRGAVAAKVQDLAKQIDVAIESADEASDVKRIAEKLRKMRRSGLAEHGEFGVENLAFKTLRNMGYISRLHDAYISKQDQALSI
jgi:predicted nucleotidyltransferase